MNKFILVFIAASLAGLSVILQNYIAKKDVTDASFSNGYDFRKAEVVSCSPYPDEYPTDNSQPIIPIMKGWGKYRMPVSTSNDSSRLYFNQGINMFYGFHLAEAMASFTQAAQFDSTCAANWLGLVLCWGPNINWVPYRQNLAIFKYLKKAKENSGSASEFEKALIEAQYSRFSTDTTISREELNYSYSEAMRLIYRRFQDNVDAGALFADALMQLHPWDLYDNKGNPKSWTKEIETLLETLLKKYPDHPGLNHYYVHCVEASNTPQRGLKSARKLELISPGLSHMIHMASHIYLRTGDYKDGVISNEKAIEAYEQYRKEFPRVSRQKGFYFSHSLSMEFANALMLPDYNKAMQIAYTKRLQHDSLMKQPNPSLNNGEQYDYSFPLLLWIRYGKWDSILHEPVLPEGLIYARSLLHYARGMAFARNNQFDRAKLELDSMQALISNPSLQEHSPLENKPAAGCKVAQYILMGVMAEQQQNFLKANTFFQKAVEFEDEMIYNEPKDWLLPARQYWGNMLLKAKQYPAAEAIFEADLRVNPKNFWSLKGLYLSLKNQNKTAAAKQVYELLRASSMNSDVQPRGAVY